jgi:ABC-type multidrug transport system ATPase subunit
MSAVVETKNLTNVTRKTAVNSLNLTVEEGEGSVFGQRRR